MKNKLVFIFTILFSIFSSAQNNKADNIEATYTLELKSDSKKMVQEILGLLEKSEDNEKDSLNLDKLESKESLKELEDMDFHFFVKGYLKNNGKYSIFELDKNDLKKIKTSEENNLFQQLGTIYKEFGTIYKDFTVKPFLLYEGYELDGKTYYFTREINYNNFKWEITSEKATIAGYETIKAVSKNPNDESQIIASVWYAPSIPVEDGPLTTGGLPGLIVKFDADIIFYKMTLTLKELNQTSKNLNIVLPPKNKIKSAEEAMNEIIKSIDKKHK